MVDKEWKDIFENQFNRSVGYEITYLTFLFAEYDGKREPCFAWMKTSDNVWHRFFIDVWMPHWEDLDSGEAKEWLGGLIEYQNIEEYIEEDLEEYEEDLNEVAYKWSRVNSVKRFNLSNKKLLNAETKYFEVNGLWCTQLKIDIEGNNEIIWNEYADKKDEELICNGIKI